MDTEVLFVKWLDPEEKALWDEITGRGGGKDTMSMAESLQWLLLKEISQHRAVADGLHRRLVSLHAVERKTKQEAFDRLAKEEAGNEGA